MKVGLGPLSFSAPKGPGSLHGDAQSARTDGMSGRKEVWQVADSETADAARSTCETVVAGHGLEIVEFFLGREGPGRILRVTVDRPGDPITLDDLTEVSEKLSRALDRKDPIRGTYTLEVASAGLERPLVRPGDFVRFTGREVKVKCHEPIEGRRAFQGKITSASESAFVLEMPGEEVAEIPYSAVKRANLVVDWEAEFRRRSEARIEEEGA